ncbi:conserved exported hypothetical protein [Candidatus Terasakiella magnetica]|nr:conserved exported hypothetical protein [Candidatus Terasakiella magnetica]
MAMIWRSAAMAGVMLLSGCGFFSASGFKVAPTPLPDVYTFMQLEAFSLINTRKTVADHIIGWITGKDCSSPRAERGETYYCIDYVERPAPPPQVYCYNTLGRPTCYAQPYNEGNDRLIGFVPASTPVR